MTKEGHAVALLSGELTVDQRADVIGRFRRGIEKVLITTNVSARGTYHQLFCLFLMTLSIANAVLTCQIELFRPSSSSDWNNFISARGNLREIISILFRKLIAAREYFPTCSVSL